MKKLVIILSVILILIGLGILLYLLIFFDDDPEAREQRAGFFNFDQEEPDPDQIREEVVNDDSFLDQTDERSRSDQLERDMERGLWRVSPVPAAFGQPLIKEENGELIIQMVSRAEGDIYKVIVNNPQEYVQITENTDLPYVYLSYWTAADTVIAQFAEQNLVESIVIDLPTDDQVNTEPGAVTHLTTNTGAIENLTVSPAGNEIFFTLNGQGFISDPKGVDRRSIFQSPLTQWQVNWPNSGTLTLTSAPAHDRGGHMFLLNTNTGQQEWVLGGIAGLSTLTNQDLSYTLLSAGEDDVTEVFIYDHQTEEFTSLNEITTLADKCVWSSEASDTAYCAVPSETLDGQYPDIWYRGLANFSDELWRINAETGETEFIRELDGKDAVDLTLSPDENQLLFLNRHDSHIWAVDIKQSD